MSLGFVAYILIGRTRSVPPYQNSALVCSCYIIVTLMVIHGVNKANSARLHLPNGIS